MTYAIIQPPFTLEFNKMSKKELEAYRIWFHKIMPERLTELTNAVKGTPGYENWKPFLTPESLVVLGRWFEGQVKTRKRTFEEMEEIRSKLTFPIDISENELTNRTFSLAVDIGMYFAQVILKNVPGSRWDQILKDKRYADYGQPVIVGSGMVPLNPVRVIVTTAYAISGKKPAGLRELYDIWVKMLKPS